MQAVVIRDGALVFEERPDPEPGYGQVLVRVRAAGLNNADLMQRRGGYPAPPDSPQDIPGVELAGKIAAIGPGVLRWKTGDRVMAVIGGGAQAEQVLVHERLLMPVPERLSWEAAGGFPEVFAAAYDALFTECGLASGDRLLVQGAAGGVGTAAVQLGVAAGARVTATIRNPAMMDGLEAFGAWVVPPEGFGRHGPFDVILELIGVPNMAENLASLAIGGRIAVIGISGDPAAGTTASINIVQLMQRRARIMGSTLRARSLEENAAVARALEARVLPLVASGRIAVPVAVTFPLSDATAAYERFAAGSKFGKIVLTSFD
jgi:NADPH:quinone reductase-like Zn-dependent oxidoreductase